ncbi:hypothetical protein Tco_0157532 [Tanacetum coccineum]
MKLMHFLMGLDDTYMQIRSSIISREILPDAKSTYAIISSEEYHKVASSSIVGSSQRNQASAFVSNVPNRGIFQRNQTSNIGPRPNNVNNNRQGKDGYQIQEEQEEERSHQCWSWSCWKAQACFLVFYEVSITITDLALRYDNLEVFGCMVKTRLGEFAASTIRVEDQS